MEQMRFHLEYFEGPLDLLLHLIRESKIEIESVFMSDVTEQYLSYMDELDRVDIEAQAEFLKSVSNWAVDYMKWATAVEMITGKPNDAANTSFRMDPQGEATRAECAAMLMRFENKYIPYE